MNIDPSIVVDRAPELFSGLLETVEIAVMGALLAFAVGIVVTLINFRGREALKVAARIYTTLCLGLPLLVVIYVLFYVLPDFGLVLEPKLVGVAALALYYGPYFAEVMRAAIDAIPRGQFEAAIAVGLPPLRTMRTIVLPQALPFMLPSLTGLLIGLIKDTALLSVVSVHEFMYFAKEAVSDTYAPLEIYSTVALTYWLLTASLAVVTGKTERRLLRYRIALVGR